MTEEGNVSQELESRPWEDLTKDAQVERMRQVIKELQSRVNELDIRIVTMEGHDHSLGRVVVSVRSNFNYGPTSEASGSRKPWF